MYYRMRADSSIKVLARRQDDTRNPNPWSVTHSDGTVVYLNDVEFNQTFCELDKRDKYLEATRDKFIAAVMQGLISSGQYAEDMELTIRIACKTADLMLRLRKEKQ